MNDGIKILSIVAVCAIAGFFLLQHYGVTNPFKTSRILASSEKTAFPRIGNYIPDSWKGNSVDEEKRLVLADNTVTQLGEIPESFSPQAKALAKKELDKTILTASVANASGSLQMFSGTSNSSLYFIILIMLALIIFLSYMISKKKKKSYSQYYHPQYAHYLRA